MDVVKKMKSVENIKKKGFIGGVVWDSGSGVRPVGRTGFRKLDADLQKRDDIGGQGRWDRFRFESPKNEAWKQWPLSHKLFHQPCRGIWRISKGKSLYARSRNDSFHFHRTAHHRRSGNQRTLSKGVTISAIRESMSYAKPWLPFFVDHLLEEERFYERIYHWNHRWKKHGTLVWAVFSEAAYRSDCGRQRHFLRNTCQEKRVVFSVPMGAAYPWAKKIGLLWVGSASDDFCSWGNYSKSKLCILCTGFALTLFGPFTRSLQAKRYVCPAEEGLLGAWREFEKERNRHTDDPVRMTETWR